MKKILKNTCDYAYSVIIAGYGALLLGFYVICLTVSCSTAPSKSFNTGLDADGNVVEVGADEIDIEYEGQKYYSDTLIVSDVIGSYTDNHGKKVGFYGDVN